MLKLCRLCFSRRVRGRFTGLDFLPVRERIEINDDRS